MRVCSEDMMLWQIIPRQESMITPFSARDEHPGFSVMEDGPVILGWGYAVGEGPLHLQVSELHALCWELDVGLETYLPVSGIIHRWVYA